MPAERRHKRDLTGRRREACPGKRREAASLGNERPAAAGGPGPVGRGSRDVAACGRAAKHRGREDPAPWRDGGAASCGALGRPEPPAPMLRPIDSQHTEGHLPGRCCSFPSHRVPEASPSPANFLFVSGVCTGINPEWATIQPITLSL